MTPATSLAVAHRRALVTHKITAGFCRRLRAGIFDPGERDHERERRDYYLNQHHIARERVRQLEAEISQE